MTTAETKWGMSCLNLLSNVFGRESHYYTKFEGYHQAGQSYGGSTAMHPAIGVMLAAKDDYEKGYVFNLRTLVTAEVFEDLLEQAEQLLKKGYFIPAAVLAGCVLEDGLRKLYVRDGITLPDEPNMNWMNGELAKKNSYSVQTMKDVTSLAGLRNDAAHGKWVTLSPRDVQKRKEEVERMIPAIRSFLEYQL